MTDRSSQQRRLIRRRSQAVALIVTLPAMLAAIVWAASVVGDSNRVPAEIAASARERGVMLCADGSVDHDDDTFWDRVASAGTFRCTSWRMRGEASSTTTGAVGWPSSPKR